MHVLPINIELIFQKFTSIHVQWLSQFGFYSAFMFLYSVQLFDIHLHSYFSILAFFNTFDMLHPVGCRLFLQLAFSMAT